MSNLENVSIETQEEYKPRRGYSKITNKPNVNGRPKGCHNKRFKWRIHCYNIETDEWETIPELFRNQDEVAERIGLDRYKVNNLMMNRCNKKLKELYKIERV